MTRRHRPPIPRNPTLVDVLLAVARLEERFDDVEDKVDDIEKRTRVVEATRWAALALVSALIVVAPFVFEVR